MKKRSRKKRIQRFLFLTVGIFSLLSLNFTALFAASDGLAAALSSIDVLNSTNPFATTNVWMHDGSDFENAVGKYQTTGSAHLGSYLFSYTPTIQLQPYKSADAFIPFRTRVQFVVGYTYDITVSLSTQIFDDSDVAYNPGYNMQLRFSYGTTTSHYNSSVIKPVSVAANSQDGYDVRFVFTLDDPSEAMNYNFDPNIGANGAYEYTHIVFRFVNNTPSVYNLSTMFYVDDIKCTRSDGDAYLAGVIADGFDGIKDDVQQGFVDGMKEYDETMPDVDYSDGQKALEDYGNMESDVSGMIDSGAVTDAFAVDLSALAMGVSCAGSFINFLYNSIPWFNWVIPVAVCFSALALLLGLVKNR